MTDAFDRFMKMSAVLTGYTVVELQGTGVGQTYFDEALGNAGPAACTALLDAFEAVEKLDTKIGELLLAPLTGPLAHNIMRMWLTGNWYALGDQWHTQFGGNLQDQDRVVSATGYREGLVWQIIGAHPMSAKQPGFGTWAFPPEDVGGGA